jgi:hypothetical protein
MFRIFNHLFKRLFHQGSKSYLSQHRLADKKSFSSKHRFDSVISMKQHETLNSIDQHNRDNNTL